AIRQAAALGQSVRGLGLAQAEADITACARLLLAAFVLLACWSLRPRSEPLKGWNTAWRRHYLKHFGWVFHLVALTFAAVHLTNFVFNHTPYWLLPLLVLPQW
ncbi:hypothetical protein, partial [Listeria seeligeri]|uniref:hypothetical protein n=1 Tax=Listeria seeligeri TaxID=1640 RepID=UPI0022EA1E14